ncbi:MAG: hypothetical protein NXI17_03095 [Alphaproteobacteria bacterium]|nr:hypothetical protein [Alphaproteobacteria bacterium]
MEFTCANRGVFVVTRLGKAETNAGLSTTNDIETFSQTRISDPSAPLGPAKRFISPAEKFGR